MHHAGSRRSMEVIWPLSQNEHMVKSTLRNDASEWWSGDIFCVVARNIVVLQPTEMSSEQNEGNIILYLWVRYISK